VHPHLREVALDIAYRGSPEPQLLDVGIELAGPAELPLASWAVQAFVDGVNRGLFGSADFAPTLGAAALEASTPDPSGLKDAFRLSVTAASPLALRVLVELLAGCGHPNALRAISIVGSLPPDATRLSVRDRDLGAWLADPAAYPRAWPEPGFRVQAKSIPRGATIRVTLERGSIDDVGPELEEIVSTWQSAVRGYPNAKRTERGLMDPHASFARSRSALHAKLSLFDHERETAKALLVNALARFHATTARIASLDIGMP